MSWCLAEGYRKADQYRAMGLEYFITHLVTHLVWPHQQDKQPERPRA